ncbi:hypothetical protein [Streptomyces sp. NPDC059552]|uniref:hypothetical protein n=1 Tax=Streptomyces sp. NPDC059552 TaxID=3346862 RepID=UPI0036AF85DD
MQRGRVCRIRGAAPADGLAQCRVLAGADHAAAELGVSQRSVERYRKTPPQPVADRIDTAVRAHWQPVVRGRRREAATSTGITVEVRRRTRPSSVVPTGAV